MNRGRPATARSGANLPYPCPKCGAAAYESCRSATSGLTVNVHNARTAGHTVQDTASLHPSTVTNFSTTVYRRVYRRRPASPESRSGPVTTTRVHPDVWAQSMRYVAEKGLTSRCIEVLSPTEVVIHNR